MSAIQSNLSASQYGYDMVVGVTQASINATMKSFLDKYKGHEFVMCYVYQTDPTTNKGSWVSKPFEDIKQEIGGDPFSIPDGAPSDNALLQKLYQMKFGFAFRASIGLPTEFPLDKIPNVIVLDKGNSLVTYNLVCKNFEVLNLTNNFGDITWSNISQSSQSEPWVFSFNVNLDLRSSDSAFAYLPKSVQDKVKNLSPGSMFSVQQLYLDLNTAGLDSAPSISGLDPTSDAYIFLTRTFINSYFKDLQKNNQSGDNPDGNFLLGYSIKPSKPGPTPSIVPTDLNFLVSPYLDSSGNPTKDYDMYTLNYLIMADDHHMPAAVPFGWNWVEKANEANFNGVMAIKKAAFVDYLNKLFSPQLNSVSFSTSCSIDCVNPVKMRYNIGMQAATGALKYQVVNDGSSKVLTYSYTKSSNASKDFCWGNWGNITFKYTVDSEVHLTGNTIQVITTTTAWMHVNVDGGVAEGNFVKYKSTVDYQLGVDAYGQLKVTLVGGKPNVKDESDDINPGVWGTIVTAGTYKGFIKEIKGYLTVIETFLSNYNNQILAMLNGSHVWVFPGGKTFVFKNVQFSNNQDLVADVTYAEPTAERLNKTMTAASMKKEEAELQLH
ncbi:hypothetical protein ACFQ1M_05645 [Sungkyunkwania multivorans]|uniref:Uncharacterized protein n=1 Tax=Sungkyunkwania multivorans TaxID=1173618 RepID=A0ABW3CV83_9FLAO